MQKSSRQVDILIRMDIEGLHPGIILAEAAQHLQIKASPFGPAIMGSHSERLMEDVQVVDQSGCRFVDCHVVVRNRVPAVCCH